MQLMAKVGMSSTVFLIQTKRAGICPSQKEEYKKKRLLKSITNVVTAGFILLKHDTQNSNSQQNNKHRRDSWPLCFSFVCPLYLSRPAAAKFRV
jgi:hypothetical protein